MTPKSPLLLSLVLSLAPLVPASPAAEPHSASQPAGDSPAAILASQIEEIATSTTLPRKTQVKMVASAVRLAIATAIEGIKEPSRRFDIALELIVNGVKAAPQFAGAITAAALELPEISATDGAAQKIEAAVKVAVENSPDPEIANPSPNRPRRPVNPEHGGLKKGEVIVSPSS